MSSEQLLSLVVVFVVVLVVGSVIGWVLRRPLSERWQPVRVWFSRALLLVIFGVAIWLLVTSLAG